MFSLKDDGLDRMCSRASLFARFFCPRIELPRPSSLETADSSRISTLHNRGILFFVVLLISRNEEIRTCKMSLSSSRSCDLYQLLGALLVVGPESA